MVKKPPSIDVKQAVKAATEYLRSLYDDASDIRLEEVIWDEAKRSQWRVTLSFARFPSREYKKFVINAKTGRVTAMRIRTV
jgi:hypothetical protein